MGRHYWLTGVVALTVLGLVTPGCSDGFGGFLISDRRELEIGESVDIEIEREYPILEVGHPVSQWAVQLVDRLEDFSYDFRDPDDFGRYKIEVIVDDDLINAFAAPGGYCYITTGLILEASSCAEIAGVMGHELGHVTERHGVKSLETAFLGQSIAELIFGDGALGGIASTIWAFLNGTTWSQDKESESDSVGLQVMFDAGYNPYGLVDFFDRLVRMEAEAGFALPEFLSSHPASEDRVRDVAAEIETRYGTQVERGVTQSYECVGTQLTLAEIQSYIRQGALPIRAGTGLGQ